MARLTKSWPLFLFGLSSVTQGQTCNPIKSSVGACTPNPGLNTSHYYVDFTQQSSLPAEWILANYETVTFGSHGAEFTFNKRYDAPNIWTDFYIFFGHVDVVMQAAPGQGIVSSSVLISDDYDEIDWEFSGNNFGAISSSGQVQTNFYGKGDTGYYDRSGNENVNQPQASFHTYSVDWTKDQLVWSIDGTTVRTLFASQCDNDTHQYPQSPMKLQLGLWDGGDPDGNAGTVNWAGGYTNLSQAPFTMYVQSVSITNDNPGYGYNYTDLTGSWESIQILTAPLNSTSSVPSSTIRTSTSSTPPTELSSSSLSPLPSSSTTSSVLVPSIGPSGTGASVAGTSESGSSGLVSSILSSSSSPSISADAASTSAATSNTEDCECEDETSTASLSTPMSSQASQVSVANTESSQPASAGISAGVASSQPPDQATTLLSLSSYTSVTQVVSQPSSSGLAPSFYASSSPTSQSQPVSQGLVPSSIGLSEAASSTSQSYGSWTTESLSQSTIPVSSTSSYGSSTDAALTSSSVDLGSNSPSSGFSILASATSSTTGFGIRPKGSNTQSTNITFASDESFLSPSKTSDHPSSVSVASVPTTPISTPSPTQSTISIHSSGSSTDLPDSPTGNTRSTTPAKPVGNTSTSDLDHSSTSKWASSYISTSATRLATSTLPTLKPTSPLNSSSSNHSTNSSQESNPYDHTSLNDSSTTSMVHSSSSLRLFNTTDVSEDSSLTHSESTAQSASESPNLTSTLRLTSTSTTTQVLSTYSETSSSIIKPTTSSVLPKSSSSTLIHSSSTSHSPSTTLYVPSSTSPSTTPHLPPPSKSSSTPPKPSSASSRPTSSTCSTQLAVFTHPGSICGVQGQVPVPALLQPASSSNDLDTCRNQCLDKSDCASFSYDGSTKQCEMYSRTLQEQGGVQRGMNNWAVNYHRDCFETAYTTYGAAKSTSAVPLWRFGGW
ncbi:glycoside hydrolase family 16 protein [Viridothelium virens]|uniref:Glycoside hydrolase family 16 protein n=1 Tax=Viridothelium virens TaxID=1048519 RepID=A0A6A6HGD3_VIRVR|nr:glycoside hydrolase family 16 protein [Viridothelium virens]